MSADAPAGGLILAGRIIELDVVRGRVDVITATDENGNSASVTIRTRPASPAAPALT